MISKLTKHIPRSFSAANSMSVLTPDSLTSADVNRILQNPTADITLEEKPTIPESVAKKVKESIFDLNHSRVNDMYQHFLETKSIQAVNERFGVQLRDFRYGLPIPNIDPGFKNLEQLTNELNPPVPTPLENLYSALSLTADSNFDEYQLAIQRKYNFYELLGGTDDETPQSIEIFKKTSILSIPYNKLRDEKHMLAIRKTFTLNLNIPGCVEVIDPRRFFPDLRPIEEFRLTPQTPISASEMQRFEEAKDRRRNAPFELVYSREKLAALGLFLLVLCIIGVFFKLGMDAEERMIIDYRRKKLSRENSKMIN